MIFGSGGISSSSSRYDSSQRIARVESATKVAAVSAVSGSNYLSDEQKQKNENQEKKEKFHDLLEQSKQMSKEINDVLKSTEEMKLSVIKQVITLTQKMKDDLNMIQDHSEFTYGLTQNPGIHSSSMLRTQWYKSYVASGFLRDTILTAFFTSGYALRTDGRSIPFKICVEMTDAFCKKYDTYTQQNNPISEPIMIRVDNHIDNIADMRFLLDLNQIDDQKNSRKEKQAGISNVENVYHTLSVWMKDVNGNSMNVDLHTINPESAYQRNISEVMGFFERTAGNRMIKNEVYDIPEEEKEKKPKVDFSV